MKLRAWCTGAVVYLIVQVSKPSALTAFVRDKVVKIPNCLIQWRFQKNTLLEMLIVLRSSFHLGMFHMLRKSPFNRNYSIRTFKLFQKN